MATRRFRCSLTVTLVVALLGLQDHVFASEESAETGTTETVVETALNTMLDSILEDLTEKYNTIKVDEFWHPYVFGTGNVNREVIKLEDITQNHIPGNFIQWKSTKLGLKQQLVGLTTSSVEIFDSTLQKTAFKDALESPKTMEVYTRWDAEKNSPVMIILIATEEPSLVILKSNGVSIQQVGTFPLHFNVKTLSLCRVNSNEKIMLVPENSDLPISLYNLEITADDVQLWFFQRFSESGFKSALVHQPDTVDSTVIIAQPGHLNIYSFDVTSGQFSIQQTLPTQQVCDNMLPFTLMYQHHIACLAKEDALQNVQFISYNYNMNEYEERDTFKEIVAKDVFPIAIDGSRDDTVLMTRTAGGAVNVLAYNGQSEFEVGTTCTIAACQEATTYSKGAGLVIDDTTAYVLPTPENSNKAPVLLFFTSLTSTSSPVFQQSMGLFGEFKALSQQLGTWRRTVSSVEDTLANKLDTEKDNIITGNWQIQTISTEHVAVEGRDANSEDVFNVLKFGDVEWTEEDFASTNDEIASKMQSLDSSLKGIMIELDDALLRDFAEQQVVTSPTLMKGSITANSISVDNLGVGRIWGEETGILLDSLAHKDSDTLNVETDLVFAELSNVNRLQTASINEVPIDSLARLSANNEFHCDTTFENVQALQNIHTTTVNEEILAESIVTVDDIPGFTFIDGIVAYKGATTMEQHPFENVVLSSASQTILSPVSFDKLDSLAPISVGQLNEKEFSDYASKIITKDHQGKITGAKKIQGGASLSTLFISETWNTVKFPGGFFSSKNPVVVLDGLKSFKKLVAEKVLVDKDVNGINLQNLVTLSEAEDLSSEWTFKDRTKILGNMVVEERVGGVLMESLLHTETLDKASNLYEPDADIVFKQPVLITNLNVDETINDKKFDELFGNLILFDDSTKCLIPGKTTIAGDAAFGDMQIGNNKINNFHIDNFLTKDSPQTINSGVTFTKGVFFEEMYSHAHFDGIKVQDVLERALRVSESTTTVFPWNMHFDDIVCQNNLMVEGPINDLGNYGLSVARTHGPQTQTFMGPIATNSAVFQSLSTENLSLDPGRTLQTLDINAWDLNRARLSDATSFSKPFTISKLLASGNLDTDHVNGIPILDFQQKVFRSDRDFQQFTGHLDIKRGLSFTNGVIQLDGQVDGVDLRDVIQNGLLLNSDSDTPIVINDNWEFESLKMDKPININSNLCGVDLSALQSDSVKRGEKNVQIFAEKAFTQPMVVNGGLDSPQINNKDFIQDVFLLHEDQEVQSNVVFASNVFNDMIEADSINNLPVSWLSQVYSFRNGKHTLNHDVSMGGLQSNSMSVFGTLQNKELDKFLKTTYKASDANILFADQVIMESPVTVDGGIQTKLYNGINVDELLGNVVMLDRDVTVEHPVSFSGVVDAPATLSVRGNLDAVELANGMNWNELVANAINITDDNADLNLGDVKFDHLFAFGPVSLENLNGKPFEDYATLSSEQDLGSLKVSRVFLDKSNVDITGNLGQYDISKELKDTLMANEPGLQRVTGATVIRGNLHVTQDLNCFGPQFKDQVVTTHQDLVLNGPVVFSEPLVVEGAAQVSEPIQGHTIESLFANAFRTDEEQVVSDNWEFVGPVSFVDNVSGEGLAENLNIQSLIEEKDVELRAAQSKLDTERKLFTRRCRLLNELREDIARSPVKLDSFDTHQVIALRNEVSKVLPVGTAGSKYLFAQTTNCVLERYRWEQDTQLFHKIVEEPFNIGNVESWQSASSSDDSVIVVFSNSPDSCSQASGFNVMSLSPNGDFSSTSVTSITQEEVKSFKLVTEKSTGNIMMFALFREQNDRLFVYQWDGQHGFLQNGQIQFEALMDRVDVVATDRGFGIMCHNEDSVHMYDYKVSTDLSLHETKAPILASRTAPVAVFENFGRLYALVPESGATAALIQPTCNFQLMRVNDGAVSSVQKLQVPQVISSTKWTFADQNYIAFLSKSHGLLIYKFMGLNGFQQIGSPYKVFGGRELESCAIRLSGFEEATPFMFVVSSNTIEVFKSNVFGDTTITNFETLCNT